jgi:hypothetical protein
MPIDMELECVEVGSVHRDQAVNEYFLDLTMEPVEYFEPNTMSPRAQSFPPPSKTPVSPQLGKRRPKSSLEYHDTSAISPKAGGASSEGRTSLPTPISPKGGLIQPAIAAGILSSITSKTRSLRQMSEDRGKTALHISAERGNIRIVQFLIENGVDVDITDGLGRTGLHYAAFGAHFEVVACLLAAGADADARDLRGLSPLHVAAEAGCEAVVELLVR